MKISILTPSYNQGDYIEENILSVIKQKDVEVEHIIIDGGSSDHTVDILKRYPHLIWVSEKDEGQSDALQKGLKMATGDVIGWINSDDYLADNILSTILEFFKQTNPDWIIGNIGFLNENSGKITLDKSQKITRKSLLSNPDILRQQGTFIKKSALIQAGGFDKKYHMVMDLDLWFRLLNISEPLMYDKTLAYFRIHENQKTSGSQIFLQLKEMLDVFKNNRASLFYRIKIIVRKITFSFRLKLIQCVRFFFPKR